MAEESTTALSRVVDILRWADSPVRRSRIQNGNFLLEIHLLNLTAGRERPTVEARNWTAMEQGSTIFLLTNVHSDIAPGGRFPGSAASFGTPVVASPSTSVRYFGM